MSLSLSRRQFLKHSAVVAAAAAVPWRAFAANDKLVVAIMGCNSRGMAHIKGLLAAPNVEIGYICDVDERAIAKGIKAAAAKQGKEPKGAKDIRKVLEDKSVDAIAIAAPNHWHAIATIMACSAGKHVYVEKPGSHDPHESELTALGRFGQGAREFPKVSGCLPPKVCTTAVVAGGVLVGR